MTVQDIDAEVGNPNSKPSPDPNYKSYGTVNSDSSLYDIPPADGGRAAWLFLLGCFVLEGFVWGLPYSYGVFEKYYSDHEKFSDESGIAAIGTVGMGIAYFCSPLILMFLQKWPSHRKDVSIVGLFIIAVSLITASFSQNVTSLVITQGLLYGLGGALLYNPFIFYLDEWFIKRKGLAYGVFWAGSGIFGIFVPLILEKALNRYGFEVVLRIYALVEVSVLSLLVYYIKPRFSVSSKSAHHTFNIKFLKSPTLWAFQCGNILQGLCIFMPQIYMPSYAYDVGFSSLSATLSVSIYNCACTIGPVFIGALIDRLHTTTVLAIISTVSALAVFFLWGFAVHPSILYIFAIVWGVFAYGYSATWTGCARSIQKESPSSELAVIIGFLAAGRGIGAMVSGPISESLLNLDLWTGKFENAYGTRYGILIVFTGLTAFFGGFGVMNRFGTLKRYMQGAGSQSEETEPLIE